jgi:hypothetical protein
MNTVVLASKHVNMKVVLAKKLLAGEQGKEYTKH